MAAGKKASKPVGINVYEDSQGRFVYYNRFNKKGYQILKSDYTRFNVLSNRLITSLAVGYLTYALTNKILFGLIALVLIYIAMFIAFRKMFIKGSTYVDYFKPSKEDSFINRLAKNTPKKKICIIIALLLAIVVLSIINAKTSNYDISAIVLNYVLAAATFVIAILYSYVLFYKIKNNL